VGLGEAFLVVRYGDHDMCSDSAFKPSVVCALMDSSGNIHLAGMGLSSFFGIGRYFRQEKEGSQKLAIIVCYLHNKSQVSRMISAGDPEESSFGHHNFTLSNKDKGTCFVDWKGSLFVGGSEVLQHVTSLLKTYFQGGNWGDEELRDALLSKAVAGDLVMDGQGMLVNPLFFGMGLSAVASS
jgi:hypothetical protein